MASSKPGLVVLFRRLNVWEVFEEGVEPSQIDGALRSCKAVTASPWIWYGPAAIAAWMIKHPHGKEEAIPYRTVMAAKRELSALWSVYQKATTMLGKLKSGLKVPALKTPRRRR